MSEPLTQLLEKMHVSRAALAQQLDQIPAGNALGTQLVKKALTPKAIGVAIAVVFAAAVLFSGRQRR
jgi:hypothetical protein